MYSSLCSVGTFIFLCKRRLQGLQFLFNFLVNYKGIQIFFQRGFPSEIDQISFGFHPFNAVFEILELEDSIRAIHAADFFLGEGDLFFGGV